MIRKILVAGLLVCISTAPALADEGTKERATGLGLGAIIGGAAGGPPGAIIGGALGTRLGEVLHERDEEVTNLTSSLEDSQNRTVHLQSNIDSLQGEVRSLDVELQEMREFAKPELLALLNAGIEMDLLFRTDEDVLSDVAGSKISTLAASLVGNPEIQIRLDGYADERGDATYNQELSLRRVEYVRDLLVANGVPAFRIVAQAHGESPATEANVDSYALERRVSLVLHMSDTPSFASNPQGANTQ